MDRDIYLIGLNHKTASVEVREKFALTDCKHLEPGVVPVEGCIKEAMVLSTCNRVELIVVGEGDGVINHVIKCWADARGQRVDDLEPYVYKHKGLEAVQHLFTVASSLDSLVVGEPQILGQLKTAYHEAVDRNATRVILNRLLHKAFSVAKRVRTETGVASSAVSISYAAVELAKRIFGDMGEYTAMLIGAGEMAELAATHLLNNGIKKIYVANRTFERGQLLAEQFNGEAIAFSDLFTQLEKVDIIISSTGAHEAVIRAKDIRTVLKKRKNRPMFFIDIAVPRDIDPDVNALDNVYLYDIDDLKEVVEENLAQRQEEAQKARAIVESETQTFSKWLRSLELQPTIVDLVNRSENIVEEELIKCMKRLEGANGETEKILRCAMTAVAKKMNHEPISFLKRRHEEEEAGDRYIDITRRMFNLDDDPVRADAHGHRRKKH
ncbi:glutamyl-tRNA reductase [Desulfovibrio mangrovi]|uniref:glutamyl-tRNA reductase n=1 Tax=Desulfovibrio mangrovi TaxID=2976983 RepID=UPI0022482363|nr:glutamyl-tRNA reductase [Desulfovibrio mangrovi]UZP68351.1 glutamyl-tRNA reductase [Desulfovibrio mangrovi]